jgi:hypothetical protein
MPEPYSPARAELSAGTSFPALRVDLSARGRVISSANGGASWSAPTTVAGPFGLSLIASTSQGFMVGDYISCSGAVRPSCLGRTVIHDSAA